jgi:asparagine N-glycosylation enzyme membrane subunit Stt3
MPGRKKEKDFSIYKLDTEAYKKELFFYANQPAEAKAELAACGRVMALCLPLFGVLSFFFFGLSVITGSIAAPLLFAYLKKRVSLKPAAAAVLSIAFGIIAGGVYLPYMIERGPA